MTTSFEPSGLTIHLDCVKQVHYKFELMEETLFLTINLIDRFLERQIMIRKKLQLVGVTAMLIACKYEEVSVPTVEDFILITDKAYKREEVLNMVRFAFIHCYYISSRVRNASDLKF